MGKETILVVHPTQSILEAVENVLGAIDYRVIGTNDESQGIDLFIEHKPVLVILGLKLKAGDAVGFLEKLDLGPLKLPGAVIIWSAGEEADFEKCFDLGATASIRYPFEAFELRAIVRAQVRLNRAEARLRLMSKVFMDGIDPIIIEDLAGIVIDLNGEAEKAYGWKREELIGRPIKEIVPKKWHDKADELLERCCRGEIVSNVESFRITKDGREHPVLNTLSLLTDEENVPVAVATIAKDISELRRAEMERRVLEQRVYEAQKLESLGVLAGGIAHDFNNILVGVLGNADLALLRLPPESPALQNIRDIRASATILSGLTKQMLAFSGRGQFVIEPLNLSRLIEEMGHLVQASLPKKVVVKYDLMSNIPPIMGDASQLRQVIMNLVINGAEAVDQRSGVVAISTGFVYANGKYLADFSLGEEMQEGYYVYLEVSDTGVGMDSETMSEIYNPFFTTKVKGRGLGLAAVQGIVRGHGGAIKVYSERGHGTSFKILFPQMTQQRIQSEEEAQELFPTAGNGTVLVVDDEEVARAVAKQALEFGGYTVLTAANGLEALRIVRQSPEEIDLVLLDLTMPKLGGAETFRELRLIRSDLPVILCSGYNEQDAVSYFGGKRLAGFIQKPFEVKLLVSAVHSALEKKVTIK